MKLLSILFLFFLQSTISNAQNAKPVKEYLRVPGPISINSKSYQLSWSAHPSATYYKQEYLVKGDKAEKFESMAMVEVVTGAIRPEDALAAKVEELKQMKATNPMVNFESFINKEKGEYMLDFLVSANEADGKLIVERNVYRYSALKGQPGLMLFGVSTRSYGDAVDNFLKNLKAKKRVLIDEVSKYSLPAIAFK